MKTDHVICYCMLLVSYSGESNFDDWIKHFEIVTSTNEWDNAAKLKCLSVRMSQRAHNHGCLKKLRRCKTSTYGMI